MSTPRGHSCTRGTPCVVQVAQGRAGRGEGAVGGGVDGADPAPGRGLARADVGAGVAGQVGLVDGDGGDAEPGGGRHAADAEHEGAGQVDEVGAVLGDRGGDAAAGEGDADLGIAGQRQGGDTDDGARAPSASGAVPGPAAVAGATTSGGVTAIDEVPGGLERAVGHAVDVGRERIRSR